MINFLCFPVSLFLFCQSTFSIAASVTSLNTPINSWIDTSGILFTANTYGQTIYRTNLTSKTTETFAGVLDSYGKGSEGTIATEAQAFFPYGMHGDLDGNIYYPDNYNHRICRVDKITHIMTVFAGYNSTVGQDGGGFNGDNLAATSALIKRPTAIWPNEGEWYFVSNGNNRIRKVDIYGIIHTVAGTGDTDYNGDNLPATSSNINYPIGVYVDTASNVYLSDSGHNMIRKVDSSTNIMVTLTGTGAAGFIDNVPATSGVIFLPTMLWGNSQGELYVADSVNCRIRKLSMYTSDTTEYSQNSLITTVVGNGFNGYTGDNLPATSTSINVAFGIFGTSDGTLIITDTYNNIVRMVNSSDSTMDNVGGIIRTISGITPMITTITPTVMPTGPSHTPTFLPTISYTPTVRPTSLKPSMKPTLNPSLFPTENPTFTPTSTAINSTYSIVIIILPFVVFILYWFYQKRQAKIAVFVIVNSDLEMQNDILNCSAVMRVSQKSNSDSNNSVGTLGKALSFRLPPTIDENNYASGMEDSNVSSPVVTSSATQQNRNTATAAVVSLSNNATESVVVSNNDNENAVIATPVVSISVVSDF